jgi:lipopolysaccharide biosynthesis protein
MKRILLYVHFNKNEQLSEHVVYQLNNIKPLFEKIVFITNSKMSTLDRKRLSGLYDEYIQRDNIGFDFAAWRDGIKRVGWKKLEKYDSLTIMNDTCFGPIYPIENIYEQMEIESEDFWGITDHAQTIVGMPGTGGAIPSHVQSYLEVFNNNVIKSKVFQDFWNNIKDHHDVTRVIQDYETKLTSVLAESGFSYRVYFDTQEYSRKNNIVDIQNYTELLPLVTLKNKVPFLKIKSFLHTPTKSILAEVSKSDYPTELIYEELKTRDITPVSSGKILIKRTITRTANILRKSSKLKKIVKRSPATVEMLKKMQKRVFGETVISQVKPERKKEYSIGELYSGHASRNFAEHSNLLQSNRILWHETESKNSYERSKGDPRIVAIYLPQFHPFKENDEAWGKGFTEWTNVTSSTPKFVGQQQPVLPSDLGFYDLRLPEIIKEQIDLAKKYGIYGFQFYYYWFSGKKVMDLPINTVLNNKDWDFNFSICWANENWTKKWDGGDNDIIFEQKNAPDDPLKFIEDVAPILNDPRYIHEDGKPILTVYRIDLLDDPKRYAKIWRDYFREKFGKELWLVGCTNFKNFDPVEFNFDATMDFTPTGSSNPELKPWVDDRKFLTPEFIDGHRMLDNQWTGHILDFRFIAEQEIKNLENNRNYYKTVSPSWSNEARRKGFDGVTFQNSSPEIFANWLDKILYFEINIKKKKQPLVFVNAWNEWAESAMIEPSQHLGHNSLLRIAETISKYSTNKNNNKLFPAYKFDYSKDAKLAVVIHLFYPNMMNAFSERLKNINIPFDLYVSVPSQYTAIRIEKISQYHKNTNVVVVPNRGRDVLPFLTIANRIRTLNNYEYVLKLHTKKSLHRGDGNNWLVSLLDSLLPKDISKIINTLSKSDTGVIGPNEHLVSLSRHIGSNDKNVKALLKKISTKKKYKKDYVLNKEKSPFFGGTMFWVRMEFLDPLLNLYLLPSDFQVEEGQTDGTTAHAIERLFGKVLHDANGKKMYGTGDSGEVVQIKDSSYEQKYKHAE